MNLRAKWDHSLGTLEVLEFDKANDYFYVRTNMKVPEHMQARDAVLIRKVMKDFPAHNKTAIVHRSAEHARCPVNPSHSVRANITMSGMIVEDDAQLRGTKISWILSSDIRGCISSAILTRTHVNYQIAFIKGLVKASN